MNFITDLDHKHRQHNLIWMVLGPITKLTHFLPVNTSFSAENYAKQFQKSFWRGLGTRVNVNLDFYP